MMAAETHNGETTCTIARRSPLSVPVAGAPRERGAVHGPGSVAGQRIQPDPVQRLHRCRPACARDGAVFLPGTLELRRPGGRDSPRSEEHTSELQSLMRISYAVFCLK